MSDRLDQWRAGVAKDKIDRIEELLLALINANLQVLEGRPRLKALYYAMNSEHTEDQR